jgi:type IV pilus assembly protein PilW
MKSSLNFHKSRGISLIEILVATAIGVVIVAAVLVSYLGSGKARRYQSALSQMNQDAQIGLELLAREIQLAGYSQPRTLVNVNAANPAVTPSWVVSYNLGTLTAPVFGCDGTKNTVPFASPTAATVTCGAAATPTVSAFEVAYEADLKNTIPSGTNVPTDCHGQSIAVATPTGGGLNYYPVRNRYYISTSTSTNTSGRPELYCASDVSGNTQKPILENIDDLQIWYGVSANANSRQIIRYAKAGKDNTTPSTINAAGASEWQNVVSVRICLLMRSSEMVFSETSNAVGNEDTLTYSDCDGVIQTSTDRLLRRAYFTTSTLRSKMAF